MSEEILHRLASVEALKVLGRTSSFAFGNSDMSLPRISDILGVRYLLDGSIRRAGDQIRLTATLVDESGFQLWSASFDGELKGIFEFQTRIAEQVANEITRELISLAAPSDARTTVNADAYLLYLVGREFFHKRPPNWHQDAAAAFQRAIALDPGYAPPYAGLAIALRLGANDETRARVREEAKVHIARALELDPLLAEAWMARGLPNQFDPDYDLDRIITDLEHALELDPNLGMAYNWLAIAYVWSGRLEEAWSTQDRGLAIDPLNPMLLLNASHRYLRQGDFEAWSQRVLRLLELPETPVVVYDRLSEFYADFGRLSEALEWAKEALRLSVDSGIEDRLILLAMIYQRLGLPDEADYWFEQDRKSSSNPMQSMVAWLDLQSERGEYAHLDEALERMESMLPADAGNTSHDWMALKGTYLVMAGRYQDGLRLLEGSLAGLRTDEPETAVGIGDVRRAHLLALAYEHAGREEDALSTLDRAGEMTGILRATDPSPFAPGALVLPALNDAAAGNLTAGAAALRIAYQGGWRDYYAERNDPSWRGAFQSPEFEPVVVEILDDLEGQRNQVLEKETASSFRAEFNALTGGRQD